MNGQNTSGQTGTMYFPQFNSEDTISVGGKEEACCWLVGWFARVTNIAGIGHIFAFTHFNLRNDTKKEFRHLVQRVLDNFVPKWHRCTLNRL